MESLRAAESTIGSDLACFQPVLMSEGTAPSATSIVQMTCVQ